MRTVYVPLRRGDSKARDEKRIAVEWRGREHVPKNSTPIIPPSRSLLPCESLVVSRVWPSAASEMQRADSSRVITRQRRHRAEGSAGRTLARRTQKPIRGRGQPRRHAKAAKKGWRRRRRAGTATVAAPRRRRRRAAVTHAAPRRRRRRAAAHHAAPRRRRRAPVRVSARGRVRRGRSRTSAPVNVRVTLSQPRAHSRRGRVSSRRRKSYSYTGPSHQLAAAHEYSLCQPALGCGARARRHHRNHRMGSC